MSFDRSALTPNHETHVPVIVDVPSDADWGGAGRAPIPPPSLWQPGVKVNHRETNREAVVRVVDWHTNQFRAYFPDTQENDSRTTWRACRDWIVQVTLSPAEEQRLAAQRSLEAEISKLDVNELAAVSVLVDDPDPAKALAKLNALRTMGVIKAAPEVAQAALVDVRPEAPKAKK